MGLSSLKGCRTKQELTTTCDGDRDGLQSLKYCHSSAFQKKRVGCGYKGSVFLPKIQNDNIISQFIHFFPEFKREKSIIIIETV